MWLYKNHYKLRDEPTSQQQRIFMQGTDVGLLARQIFGSGADASPTDVFHYRESVRDTARLIAEGHTVIFEAAFQYEGVLCAVDILIKHRDKWYAYEVKSSTGLKDQFIQDAALQYYVISNAGLDLEDIFIVHINTGYVRLGDLQLKQLFTKHSVKEQVIEKQPIISAKAGELKLITVQKQMPNISIGLQCNLPYTCDFYGFCHQEDPIFQNNIPNVLELVEADNKITYLERPVNFLYIGTYRAAVPEYDGHWPYRHIPFQFSFINLNNAAQIEEHFVAQYGSDPVIQFVEQFKKILQNSTGQIIVRNKIFITSRINELQKDYPNYSADLELIKIRLFEISIKTNYPLQAFIGNDTKDESIIIETDEDAAAVWYNHRHLAIQNNNQVMSLIKFGVSRLKLLLNLVSTL